MKLYLKYIIAALLYCIMFMAEGCSTSVLVDVWNDPSFKEAPLKKILVIAVRKDRVHRRIWEDAFAGEFLRKGVKAIQSYNLFPEALPDTDQVVKAIHDNGFDGLLVTSPLEADTKTRYVQSYTTSEPQSRFNPFKNVYSTYYQDVQHPGYVDTLIVKRRAIDVWDVRKEGRMIWGGTSNTSEFNTDEDVLPGIAELVIAELLDDAIIKPVK
jgi:hypothetical protein